MACARAGGNRGDAPEARAARLRRARVPGRAARHAALTGAGACPLGACGNFAHRRRARSRLAAAGRHNSGAQGAPLDGAGRENRMIRTTLGAASALALLAGAAAAGELGAFRYATNWVAQAEHGGFYQAMVDGTYAACGLTVEIIPGGPQVNGRALMLAGKAEGYMGGNMISAIEAIPEGIPIVVVASSFQKEPQILMTHPGRVAKFEDVAGLPEILVGDEGFATYYRWLMNDFGFKEESRRPYTFNSAPFIANKDSAQQGYVTSEPFAVQNEAGWTPDVWLLADYGFDTYSTTIEVRRDYLEANRKAVQCFVDGTALGWINYLYGDNAAANARIKTDNPDISDAQIAYSIEAMKKYGIVDSLDAVAGGVGAMTAERHQAFYDKMVKAGVLPAGIDITQSFTLEFVNKGVGLDVKKKLTGQ
jgi:NitT/TauT family transport system substrate-binding protein